ncbi:MAG: YicC family protein [Candidatus Hydrogenedentes bacterium]|nr:YicC family protein [Candidatus Hydrogenedentota bacterium]
MTRSMTGFGKASGDLAGENVTVELSGVNHRFLECAFRLPFAWAALEPALKEAIKRKVSRGKLNVTVRRERGPMGTPAVQCDLDVAKQYLHAARELASMMSTTEALSLDVLAQLEGVFYQREEEQDLEQVNNALSKILEHALEQFNHTRESEGRVLAADIEERLRQMEEALAGVAVRVPELSQLYEARLRERTRELATEAGLTVDRLAVEVALMADKMDVTEEIVRLKSHFQHVRELIQSSEPIGRELNFLSQELQREMNTIGSKLRDIGAVREVLRMKSELEKLREQAQNIE